MPISRLTTFFFVSASLLSSVTSHADLIVSRSIVEMATGETRADLVLINSDDTQTLYVQVEPFYVSQPGETGQELIALTAEDNRGLLVSPNRLAIAPGGRSLVRILNLNEDSAVERIYRVNFTPVTPPVELEAADDNAVRSALDVVVAYQVLIMMRPENPNPVHAIARLGAAAKFTNDGNTNYLLTDGSQCNPSDIEQCQTLPDRRMYPGNQWALELPFDGPFNYSIRTPDGISAHKFD